MNKTLMMDKFMLPTARGKRGKKRIQQEKLFAEGLKRISNQIGFKQSARGWCYQLEGLGLITKAEFSIVQTNINNLRKSGVLPYDFVAEEEGRQFAGVEWPTEGSTSSHLKDYLESALVCEGTYTPNWWDDEEYYIQMVVEKIDLKNLFKPICERYHIPIASSKGWQSILMRAHYANRFKYHEGEGRKCVLLYCGDFDPTGLMISDTLMGNLSDLSEGQWANGVRGYHPYNLIIDRFGLNHDFIEEHSLSWIDGLITGSGLDLADPSHKSYKTYNVQDYIRKYGERKVEANALVIEPEKSRELCEQAIEKYLGHDAETRFAAKTEAVHKELERFRKKTGLTKTIRDAIKIIDREEAKLEKVRKVKTKEAEEDRRLWEIAGQIAERMEEYDDDDDSV